MGARAVAPIRHIHLAMFVMEIHTPKNDYADPARRHHLNFGSEKQKQINKTYSPTIHSYILFTHSLPYVLSDLAVNWHSCSNERTHFRLAQHFPTMNFRHTMDCVEHQTSTSTSMRCAAHHTTVNVIFDSAENLIQCNLLSKILDTQYSLVLNAINANIYLLGVETQWKLRT